MGVFRSKPAAKAATTHEPALGFRVWRTGGQLAMRQAHTHPDIELNWIPSGTMQYVMAGRRATIATGQLGIFWGGVPHQLIEFNEVENGIWLTLPLAWFVRCGFSHQFADRLMGGRMFTLSLAADRAAQWLEDFQAGPARQRLVLLELEALLERVALTSQGPKQAMPKSRKSAPEGANHMERITRFLASHYQELISIDDIARELNLHPKYLMTVFRKSTGITAKTYLLRLRIAHAQRLLATTQMKILDIAMESGFGSLGRFYETFSRQIGQRPLQYRKNHAE